MITEDYVSFETAKLLKEKGFEYNPDESYWLIDTNNKMYWISSIGAYDYVDVPTESFQRPKNGYRLITQALAMKWLREVHNRYIEICIDNSHNFKDIVFRPAIYDKKLDCLWESDNFLTYKEACESAIKYCLKNLI